MTKHFFKKLVIFFAIIVFSNSIVFASNKSMEGGWVDSSALNTRVSDKKLAKKINKMIQESLKFNPYSQIAVLGTIDHSSKIIRPAAREVITNFDEASFSLKFLARKNGNHTLDLKKNPQVSILLVLNEKKDQVNNLVIYGTAKKTSCTKKDCVYTVQPALIKISHSFGLTDDEINQKMKLGDIDVNMIHKNKFWYTSEVSIRDYKKSTNGTWKVIRDIEKGL